MEGMHTSGARMSAGVVVVRRCDGGWRYLLLRAYEHWDFPKGMVEPGEAPLAAAIREVAEESSINDLQFDWGDICIDTGPYSRGKLARYFLARTTTEAVDLPVNPELGHPEHSEYRWVDAKEALAMVSPRVRPVVRWAERLIDAPSPEPREAKVSD
jgi:8-oxo-dGTP pyrophosphatase MutT (NUDIX family)